MTFVVHAFVGIIILLRDASLILAEFSFGVRYGAPQVRCLRKIRVNLHRRTPLFQ